MSLLKFRFLLPYQPMSNKNMLGIRKTYETDKEILEKSLLLIEKQTWLSYSLIEQHLKNKKNNSPRFTAPNNVVRLIQLNN